MWQFWCCGNSSLNYPRFSLLQPMDMPSKNERKRLSDLKFIMKQLEEKARMLQIYDRNYSVIEASRVYEHIKEGIEISSSYKYINLKTSNAIKLENNCKFIKKKRRIKN